jgi:hypothetical protein
MAKETSGNQEILKANKSRARANAEIYKKPVKKKDVEKIIHYPDRIKKKQYVEKTYKNGVVKRRLVSVTKGK